MKIYPSKSVKYLGIHLDEHLDGSAHAEILIPKLQRANGMLAKIWHYTSINQTKSIYHAILPVIWHMDARSGDNPSVTHISVRPKHFKTML